MPGGSGQHLQLALMYVVPDASTLGFRLGCRCRRHGQAVSQGVPKHGLLLVQEDMKALRELAERAASTLKDRLATPAAKDAAGLASRLAAMDLTPTEVPLASLPPATTGWALVRCNILQSS